MSESENDIVDHIIDLASDLCVAEVPLSNQKIYLTPEEWQAFKAHKEGLHYAVTHGVEALEAPRPLLGLPVEVTHFAKEKREALTRRAR